MSQNHFNYMSGVPVKIAENFKPPKKLALNQSVAQRLANSSSVTTQLLANSTYDFSLERTVLAKMSEWQHLRDKENCDRKERLRLHQKERQHQIETKQKQMLTAVSYPSTDDLSSDDGDDSGHGTLSDASKSAVSQKPISIPLKSNASQHHQQFSPTNCFDNILVPTVMPDHKTVITAKAHAKINLQEFENDTSSPFDNIELKTINDLDILAEVWNTSVRIDKKTASNQTPTNDTVNESSDKQQFNTEQSQQSNSHSMATMMSSIPISNSFYQINSNQQQNYYNATVNNNESYAFVPNQYVASNYFNQMPNEQMITMAMPSYTTHTTVNKSIYNNDKDSVISTSIQQAKSKSKSVPDIMQEINTELENSQGARVRNSSQSMYSMFLSKERKLSFTSFSVGENKETTTPTEHNQVYRQLSISSQNLAKRISSMGFPPERVAYVAGKLGKDDKKVKYIYFGIIRMLYINH